MRVLKYLCLIFRYRQMTESGRQINLYDWFNSFCAACGDDDDDDKDDESDEDTQDTDKKEDHMQCVRILS